MLGLDPLHVQFTDMLPPELMGGEAEAVRSAMGATVNTDEASLVTYCPPLAVWLGS